jgi:hypothetical protein
VGELGDNVLLTCNSTGSPRPSVVWYSTQNILITNQTNRTKYRILNNQLEILSLKSNDTGVWKCLATNKFSFNYMRKKFGSISLNVLGAPVILNKPKYFSLIISASALLDCESSGLPKPKIAWYHQGKLIKNDQIGFKYNFYFNGSLEILHLTRYDAGTYTCEAYNLEKFPIAKLEHTSDFNQIIDF